MASRVKGRSYREQAASKLSASFDGKMGANHTQAIRGKYLILRLFKSSQDT